MQLKHMETFVEVARTRHFRRAASNLGITQPAVSNHVAHLERALGIPLFIRDRRRVELTPGGLAFLEKAEGVLKQLDDAVTHARIASQAWQRTLVVAQLDYISHAVIPRALQALRKRMPEAIVEMRDMPPDAAIEEVRAGRVDVGFAVAPVNAPDLVVRPVLRGRWSVVLPKGHPLSQRTTVPLSALAESDLIVFHKRLNPRRYTWLIKQCREAGFSPRIIQHTTQPQQGPAMVAQGMGLFLVGNYVVPDLPAGVVSRPLTGFDSAITLVAAWRAGHKTAALRAFLEGLPTVGSERYGRGA